jgi:hypothetical protein
MEDLKTFDWNMIQNTLVRHFMSRTPDNNPRHYAVYKFL